MPNRARRTWPALSVGRRMRGNAYMIEACKCVACERLHFASYACSGGTSQEPGEQVTQKRRVSRSDARKSAIENCRDTCFISQMLPNLSKNLVNRMLGL